MGNKKHNLEEKSKYIEENNLADSHIPIEFLWQVRGTVPIRKEIGRYADSNSVLFLEETQGSLRKRHYGYTQAKTTSYNLLYSDGTKGTLINDYKVFLNKYDTADLMLNGGYTVDDIINFLKYDNKHKLKHIYQRTGRKQRNYFLDDEEHEMVKTFVKRMRENAL